MPRQYPLEFRDRAVRLVSDQKEHASSEYEAIRQVATKLGLGPETVRKWVRRAQVDSGERPGLTSEEREEIKRLKRENAELRRANEILRTASAFFAAELDRPTPK